MMDFPNEEIEEKRLEMVREKAEMKLQSGIYFDEWLVNDDSAMNMAKLLFMIDTRDIETLQSAHKSFIEAILNASGIDDSDAQDALEAGYGYWVQVAVDDVKFVKHNIK